MLDQLASKTESIGADVSVIRIQNEIGRLDREWQMRCENEFRNVPKSTGVAQGWFLVVIWVLLLTVIGRVHALAAVFWMLFGVFVIAQAVTSQHKRVRHLNALHRYHSKRAQMVRDLEEASVTSSR